MSEAPKADALRYNTGKARYDLIPPDALHELAEVYTKGAEKYEPRNWERGFQWMSCFSSMMRHAWAWARGEDRDAESGQFHMAHVAWNAMALLTFSIRQSGVDDRIKTTSTISTAE